MYLVTKTNNYSQEQILQSITIVKHNLNKLNQTIKLNKMTEIILKNAKKKFMIIEL